MLSNARERVFLPFGRHVCSAERVRVSGCSYHLAGMCAEPSGCARAGVLTIWLAWVQYSAGARERVFLPFGWHWYSAEIPLFAAARRGKNKRNCILVHGRGPTTHILFSTLYTYSNRVCLGMLV